ncbi:hypothetical protein SEA_BANTAM_163 [Gordonia phage Bantam]|uniref:Uncharacterized protein n=1 Tax=Gordonia phage Bantam TaxID=1887641 RepID=A0A1B3AYP1_9CAUD|nr:hypothetical protein BIZ77_gp016 [Gordonia phage Bantam]AOE43852.1 hypothetical protein SEA_BANTAM_163 [Gordonia phage Bantam]
MYVADMTLAEAREWREELERRASRAVVGSGNHEQLSWDLQDVNDRIDELEGGE